MYLNIKAPYDKFKTAAKGTYFVDKTELLNSLISALETEERFFCITRPRRFGKTIMANMVGAFFGKAADSSEIFDKLRIAENDQYQKHLNRHNVIYIDFSEVPENCDSYGKYIGRISDGIRKDLIAAYPDLKSDSDQGIWDLLSKLFEEKDEKIIFVMDEWDAVFHMSFVTEKNKYAYIEFLKNLLKGKSYVELAYMTGILPIAKYSSGSDLNMFVEFKMTSMELFSDSFGFTEREIDELYDRYSRVERRKKVSREGLKEWYDGYCTKSGERLYNPRSVVLALKYNQLASYWTNSGPYDEIFYYIRNDIENIRDDLALMIIGEGVEAKVEEYSVSSMELKTKNQIYSAMVVYGLLTYEDGRVFIPNRELMLKYEELIQRETSLGYVYRLARKSDEMLRATWMGDTKTMAEILQYAHNTESPILAYNNETELTAVVNLVYLSARDKYRIEREDKAGKGYVDFIFYPLNPRHDGMIIELKVNHTSEEAIWQIKEKQYALKFKGKLGEEQVYTGRILAIGISYDKEKKQHSCLVEVLEEQR